MSFVNFWLLFSGAVSVPGYQCALCAAVFGHRRAAATRYNAVLKVVSLTSGAINADADSACVLVFLLVLGITPPPL